MPTLARAGPLPGLTPGASPARPPSLFSGRLYMREDKGGGGGVEGPGGKGGGGWVPGWAW